MARELLQQSFIQPQTIIALEDWLEQTSQELTFPKIPIISVSAPELKKVSTLQTPNQVLIEVESPEFVIDKKRLQSDYSLYLDRIQDPGNLGTILRIADWFGIEHVFCSKDCVDWHNPKVLQATMGAFLRVKPIIMDFDELRNQFPRLPVLGAVLEGKNIYEIDLPSNGLLVIGNEGAGINAELLTQLDYKLTIPSYNAHGAESLNAGVATGILCAILRQER